MSLEKVSLGITLNGDLLKLCSYLNVYLYLLTWKGPSYIQRNKKISLHNSMDNE